MWGFMRLECINGIEYNGQTILENEFAKYGILSTREAISDYFKKYGYRYVGVYDLAHDLIIVEDKNLEVEMILGQFYKSYRVINYKTGEVVDSSICFSTDSTFSNSKILILGYVVKKSEFGYKLIKVSDESVVLEADRIAVLDSCHVLFTRCNIDYILDLKTMNVYPIVKKDENIYHGTNPESIVDFRNGMYYQNQKVTFQITINSVNIEYLIHRFPYGVKRHKFFMLLSPTIKYGLKFEDANKEQDIIWYDSEEERNLDYQNFQKQAFNIFEQIKKKRLGKI